MRTLLQLREQAFKIKKHLGEAFTIGYGLWGTFGIVLGAISIFNLAVKAYKLGLTPVMKDLISAYQWTFHIVLLNPIWKLMAFTAPSWLNDGLVLWISGAAISYRTLLAARNYSTARSIRSEIRLGTVELYFFRLPRWKFSLVAGAVSLVVWPILWIRYLYSDPFIFKFGLVAAPVLFVAGEVTYRIVWAVQMLSVATLVCLLVVTSAGLPPAG